MAKERELNKQQRRELARQARAEELRRRARRARMNRARNVAIALVLVAGIGALIAFNAQRGAKAKQALNEVVLAAGCTALQTPPDEGRSHAPPYSYKTNPPTSGNHGGLGPTGVFRQPIKDENQVHNLEHGHVGIHYKDLDASLIDQLEKVVRGNPTRLFIAPRQELDAKLAFTAWGSLIKCNDPDERAVDVARRFASQFAGKGPEGDIPGSPQGV